MLTDEQIDRYSRQIIVAEHSGQRQERLMAGRCLRLCGGAASDTALSYLVGAGLGHLDEISGARSAAGLWPEPRERNPDVTTRELATLPTDWSSWDVVLVDPSIPPPDAPPRVGVIELRDDPAASILAVPRSGSACLACTRPALDAYPGDAQPTAAEILGAMAAQVALDWLAFGIDGRAPSAATLERSAPTPRSVEIPPIACKDGCLPRDR